jgi:hypothetical protein
MGLLKSEMSEKFSKITNIGSKKQDERVELTSAPRPKVRKFVVHGIYFILFFIPGFPIMLFCYPIIL